MLYYNLINISKVDFAIRLTNHNQKKNMFKKRIYTLIEVKNRELLGKSLFAIDLAEAGYSIVIGKKSNLYYYSKYFASGIFFFKGMGINNLKEMKKLRGLGHKIVGYDEEGLVMNQVMSIWEE